MSHACEQSLICSWHSIISQVIDPVLSVIVNTEVGSGQVAQLLEVTTWDACTLHQSTWSKSKLRLQLSFLLLHILEGSR